jgi:hypothetical protein
MSLISLIDLHVFFRLLLASLPGSRKPSRSIEVLTAHDRRFNSSGTSTASLPFRVNKKIRIKLEIVQA